MKGDRERVPGGVLQLFTVFRPDLAKKGISPAVLQKMLLTTARERNRKVREGGRDGGKEGGKEGGRG